MAIILDTSYGRIHGNDRDDCFEFLGIKFGEAKRFEYAVPVDTCGPENDSLRDPRFNAETGEYDATKFGCFCPQSRTYYEHLEVPERLFYHNEFRRDIKYNYDEDCLNLNIYTPKNLRNCPVVVFIHGGGFNSGTVKDSNFDGSGFARRGVILVTFNYRVGVLGYLTHKDIFDKYGHDGNFGLYDQLLAINWVRKHISDFGGDPENITLMGQSAGAISIQYLSLSRDCDGLFKRAVMMSGGGMFPKFALPRPAEKTREYWLDYMSIAGCNTLDELKSKSLPEIFTAIEEIKKKRKDNTYNTMPVIDGRLISAPITELIKTPLKLDYMIGYTNNDMYAPIMAHIGNKFARDNKGYVYYFDVDAPGNDHNGAFHSSDLRYVFETLSSSHRPYDEHDEEIASIMANYMVAFAKDGNPNRKGLPEWDRKPGRALCISKKNIKMGRPNFIKLTWNMITKGDPT